jgi:hypothetical protein
LLLAGRVARSTVGQLPAPLLLLEASLGAREGAAKLDPETKNFQKIKLYDRKVK